MIFRRRSMYYIFQMYIPCVCVVALSWVSFWINHEAVPARVALSITTVLTISYMRGNVNAGMPRVSYLKSIDYFLLGGFVFIFMTLLEYVLVLKQSRKLQEIKEKKTDYEMGSPTGEDTVRSVNSNFRTRYPSVADTKRMHFTWVSIYLALKVLIVDTILRLLLETGPPFYIAWSSEQREGRGWQPSSTEWINPAATISISVNFRPLFVTLLTFTFF